ncbi:MAG: hypothetical protein HY291_05850 [Planctomycetes bacterium]|nr:hypothetical protein [Planctomycetota bacterium]
MRTLACTLICFALMLCTAARAEDEKKEDATQAVKDAVKALFPEGSVKTITKEQKGKLRRFNAVVTDKEGEHKLLLRGDGSVLERTDPAKPETLPAGIVAALKKKNEKGKATAATKYLIRSKTTFEVEFTVEGKKDKFYFGEDGSEAQAPVTGKDDEEK